MVKQVRVNRLKVNLLILEQLNNLMIKNYLLPTNSLIVRKFLISELYKYAICMWSR